MAYIDIKKIVWERFEIEDDIIVPEFSTEDEVEEFISDNNLYGEFLYDTVTDMTIDQNEGASTIEVYDDQGELVFNN